MSIGLYIGRFQPLHLGHLSAIRQALSEVDKLIIGIGSAQYGNEANNPLTGEERRVIVKNALAERCMDDRCEVFMIPDIHDDELWVDHVRSIVPDFNVVFAGNEGLVTKLFEEETPVIQVAHEVDISATEIRRLILNNEPWKKYLSPRTVLQLENLGFEQRLEKLSA